MPVITGEAPTLEPSLPPLDVDESLSFLHPLTVAGLAYWRSILHGRAMPSRADLDLRAMQAMLPCIGLIEPRRKPDGSGDYYIRLAGTRTEQVFGSVSTRLISEFLPPEIEARWRLMLDKATNSKAPIRTIGRVAFQRKTWLTAETLVVPLSNDGETVAMLLVVVATWEAGKPPV